jgi:cold shock CspA family protein
MPSGKIVKLSEKGFGFIRPDTGGKNDMYFHAKGMTVREDFESLQIGDKVTYEVEEGRTPTDRPRAVGLSRV